MAAQPHEPADEGDQNEPGPGAKRRESERSSVTVNDLAGHLPAVVEEGIDSSSTDVLRGLFKLRCVRERAVDGGDDALAAAARNVLHEAIGTLGSGDYGQAARLLFGAVDDTRGQHLRIRRRVAANLFYITPGWFSRSLERQIVDDVAIAIFNIEHPLRDRRPAIAANTGTDPAALARPGGGTDTATAITTAGADTLVGQRPDGENGDDGVDVERSQRRLVLRWVRPRVPDEQALKLIVTRPSPLHAVTGSPPRQLLRDLQELRDQHARREWYLIFALCGVVLFWVFGLDAIRLYAAALALVGLAKTGVDMFAEWRSSKVIPVYEYWSRLLLLAMVVFVAGWLVPARVDDVDGDERAARACSGLDYALGQCDATTTTPTTRPVSPNSVPVTYATVPAQASEPACPPEGNQERRIRFTSPPPMCIDPDARRYTATIHTNYGSFPIVLNGRARWTVNNFVFLARWHYYDGVTLFPYPEPAALSARHLIANQPIEPTQPAAVSPVPGYSMQFDEHQGGYPDEATLYAVMVNAQYPDQFAIVITPEARRGIEDQLGAYPVLGTISTCRDVIAHRDGNGGWDVRVAGEPMVIETITITEEPATTPTTRPPTPAPNTDPCGQLAATRD